MLNNVIRTNRFGREITHHFVFISLLLFLSDEIFYESNIKYSYVE